MFRSIVVPLDGSYTAERILPWIRDFARTGAEINLVRAVPKAGLTAESDHARARERDDALRHLTGIANRLGRAEIWVQTGDAAKVVMDVARKSRADVIAMTTRGATTVRRGLFGSTA